MFIKPVIMFIIGLLTIILGILVLNKNRKSISNISYFYLCLFGGSWGLVKAFHISVTDLYLQEIFITRINYIFGILAPLFYLIFAYNFPYVKKVFSKSLKYLVYFIPLFFILLVVLGVMKMEQVQIINNAVYREANFTNFLLFTIYFFLYVLIGFIILFKKYLKDSGGHKNQLKYLLIATISTFITTGTVSIVLVLFINFKYDWLGAIFLLIHFIIAGYYIFYKSQKLT